MTEKLWFWPKVKSMELNIVLMSVNKQFVATFFIS